MWVSSYDRSLYCLSQEDGSLVFQFQSPSPSIFGTPVWDNKRNRLIVGSLQGEVFCLQQKEEDQSEFSVIWMFPGHSTPIFCTPVFTDQETIVLGDCGGNVTCLRGLDGTVVWQTKEENSVFSSPLQIDWEGPSVAWIIHNKFQIFSLVDGSLKESVDLPSVSTLSSVCLLKKDIQQNSSTFVFGCVDGSLLLVDPRSRKVSTCFRSSKPIFSSVLRLHCGTAFVVGMRDNHARCFSISCL